MTPKPQKSCRKKRLITITETINKKIKRNFDWKCRTGAGYHKRKFKTIHSKQIGVE